MRAPLILTIVAVVSLVSAYALWPAGEVDPLPNQPTDAPNAATSAPGDRGEQPRTAVATADGRDIDPHIGVVRVECRDENKAPLPGCKVKIGEADARLSGADGKVEIDLEPGRHWLDVTPPDATRNGVRQRVTATGGQLVAVLVDLLPVRMPDIWCRVVAAESQQPLAGAQLQPQPSPWKASVSGDDGVVEVRSAGESEFVQITAAGRAPRRIVPIYGHASAATAMTVPLDLAADLTLTVVDPADHPIEADVTITAMAWSLMWPAGSAVHGGPELWSERTAADGKGAFRDLPPRVKLFATIAPPPGAAAATTLTLELTPGPNAQKVTLLPLGELHGRVLDAGDRPVDGAHVVAVRGSGDDALDLMPEGDYGESITTGADGSYRLPELEPGSWLVGLQHTDGWTAACHRVDVPAGGAVKLDLRAQPSLSIGGRLLGPGNDPISAFEVHARRNGVVVGAAITERDGSYRIDGLAAGDYEIFTELYQSELAMTEPVHATAGRTNVDVRVVSVLGTVRGHAVSAPERAADLWLRGLRRDGDEFCGGRCDLDGRFEQPRLRAGVWDFAVTDGHGNVGVLHGVEVMANRTTPDLEITLRPGAVLRPTHPAADAFRVERGADVAARNGLERGLPGEAVVPPGTWTVVFLRRGFEIGRREVTVAAGEQQLVAAQ